MIEKYLDQIIQGDTLEVLKTFPDECIDCIITSPPYWGLRDYGDETNTIWGGDPNCKHEFELEHIYREPSKTGEISEKAKIGQGYRNYKSGFCKKCGAWYGQLGLEPTLKMYIEHMLQITAELKRVLKPSGVMFWNHGDSYATQSGSGKIYENIMPGYEEKAGSAGLRHRKLLEKQGIPRKSLFLQNFRLILKMVDEQGWTLRDVIIWAKKIWIAKENTTKGNAMPSSVRDRCAFTYEPVFMLTKSEKYWFNQDILRVPQKESSFERVKYEITKFGGNPSQPLAKLAKGKSGGACQTTVNLHPLGANRPNVWQINTEPFHDSHFAVFPTSLVKSLIEAGCPQWICKKCGKARERITERGNIISTCGSDKGKWAHSQDKNVQGWKMVAREHITIGWTDCGCNAGWESGVVLDPFAGSGTTLYVARKLGRHYIGIELNPEYVKMAKNDLQKSQSDWISL